MDPTKITQHTDETLYEYYDAIVAAPSGQRHEMEKAFGIKFNPNGLMSNMRRIYKPKSHTVRDWMHMLVSGGVANTQLALVFNLIVGQNIILKVVGKVCGICQAPMEAGEDRCELGLEKSVGQEIENIEFLCWNHAVVDSHYSMLLAIAGV